MESDLEGSVGRADKKRIGPLDYEPLVYIAVSTSELVISQLDGPYAEEIPRRWTKLDWGFFFVFGEKASKKMKRTYYKPPIPRQRISNVRSFEIIQDEEGRYYVEYC